MEEEMVMSQSVVVVQIDEDQVVVHEAASDVWVWKVAQWNGVVVHV